MIIWFSIVLLKIERKETDMQTSRVKRNATVLRSTMVSVVVLAYRFIWNAHLYIIMFNINKRVIILYSKTFIERIFI